MRFSVLVAQRESWAIGRGRSEADYRRTLFDDERLALHHFLFENLTLPSLAAQVPAPSEEFVRLYVITSSELPPRHLSALEQACARHRWVRIVRVPPDARSVAHGDHIRDFLAEAGHGEGTYAHVRLDDDDALSSDFLSRIAAFATPGNVGACVSLARGYLLSFDSGRRRLTQVVDYRLPMAAQGLAHLGAYKDRAPVGKPANVYGLGHHLRVDTKVPVILDSRAPAFIRTNHEGSDVQFGGRKSFPAGEPVDPRDLLTLFPSLANLAGGAAS
nr:glycosyltransferase [Rubellimicrobium aerolatum]